MTALISTGRRRIQECRKAAFSAKGIAMVQYL